MTIKKSRAKYVGGYDREYYIDSMSNSHIINCLVQIKNKLEVVEELVGLGYNSGAKASYECLLADWNALATELDSRENCTESC